MRKVWWRTLATVGIAGALGIGPGIGVANAQTLPEVPLSKPLDVGYPPDPVFDFLPKLLDVIGYPPQPVYPTGPIFD
jgi:hypothetical protein